VQRRLADLVTTILILNLAIAYIRRGTPSVRLSLLLVVVWAGARLLLRHRDRVTRSAAAAADYVRARVPEALVAVLLVIGLILRLSGVGFGKPLVLHPDEHQVVGVAVTMLKSGTLAPPVPFHYPTVFHYLLLPGFALRYVKGKSIGEWSSLREIGAQTFQFYELARAHSAVLGALTIVLTFIIARRMWPGPRGRWAGAIAASYVTFAFSHVKESHHGVTDAALTFFIVLAFIAIVTAFQRGTRASFALAGFAVGIACATKYSALPLVPTLVAAHFLSRTGAWTDWRRMAIGLAAIPVGFFTGYPYALLNWPAFLEHLGWMSSHAGSKAFNPDERFGLIVKYAMESGLGMLWTLAFAAAAAYALFRRRAEEGLAIVFTVVCLSLLSNTGFPFYARYLLPLIPLSGLVVGRAIVGCADWLRHASGTRGRTLAPLAAAAAVVVMIWTQAGEAFAFVRYSTSPDTRAQAYQYIVDHVPKGSTIASEEPYLVLPRGYEVVRWTPLHSRGIEEFSSRGVDVLVFSADRDLQDGSEAARARRDLMREYPLQAAFRSGAGGSVGPTLEIHVSPNR
jgi:4-amino-4-deoxy-L-arabinose transferase-like glycosyltransferase